MEDGGEEKGADLVVILYFCVIKSSIKMTEKKGVFYSEEELLQIRLKRTYEERFKILMQLIRLNKLLKTAVITYPEKK